MDAIARKQMTSSASGLEVLDHCLLCGACERICPSNVPYTEMLTKFRSSHFSHSTLGASTALVLDSFKDYKAIVKTGNSLKIAQSMKLDSALRFLPSNKSSILPSQIALLSKAPKVSLCNDLLINNPPNPSQTISLFLGCADRIWQGKVFQAAIHILNQLNIAVVIPKKQGCCGALNKHMGDIQSTSKLATNNQQVLNQEMPLLYLSSGCGKTIQQQHPLAQSLSMMLVE